MTSALSDLMVLDLTRFRSGPTAVRQLSDWGANVIRVDSPDGAEELGRRDGSDFQNLHRNKRSIELDLKTEAGRTAFYTLAKKADVVVENFRPGVKFKLGIDYETLAALNPRLIYASISGFGQKGPYRDRPGLDQVVQGMGGLMAITGTPETGPLRAGTAVADITSGLYCAIGVLTALHERERSGVGQWVHTSLLQAQIAFLDFQATRWLVDGEIPEPVGNDHPTFAPMGLFPTSDKPINIAPAGEAGWFKLCDILGVPGLVRDPRFLTSRDRVNSRAALIAALSAATRQASADVWVKKLNDAGIPCGEILRMDEVFIDPQVVELETTITVDHPARGELTLLAQPIQMSRTKTVISSAGPESGAHQKEVFGEYAIPMP